MSTEKVGARLTPNEAALTLGIPAEEVWQAIRVGQLKTSPHDKLIMTTVHELERFAAQRGIDLTPPRESW